MSLCHTYHTILTISYIWRFSDPLLKRENLMWEKNQSRLIKSHFNVIMPYSPYYSTVPYIWRFSDPLLKRRNLMGGTDTKILKFSGPVIHLIALILLLMIKPKFNILMPYLPYYTYYTRHMEHLKQNQNKST